MPRVLRAFVLFAIGGFISGLGAAILVVDDTGPAAVLSPVAGLRPVVDDNDDADPHPGDETADGR